MGNWDSLSNDGGDPETRTHNLQNQVTQVGSASLTFDNNGNLTTDENGNELIYDAWNRLVEVKDSASTSIADYEYDALNRRITETEGSTTTDLYYTASWQVLEEQESGQTTTQYVWSPVYVDAMVLRDRDTDSNGTLDERLYVQQDANFNVTALIDTTGNLVERYIYHPYGLPTILAPDWTTRSTSNYAWHYLHQGGRYSFDIGLYQFRYRELSPTLGRWVQNDPLEFRAGDTNLYRYVFNAPVGRVDPSGLASSLDLLGAAAVGLQFARGATSPVQLAGEADDEGRPRLSLLGSTLRPFPPEIQEAGFGGLIRVGVRVCGWLLRRVRRVPANVAQATQQQIRAQRQLYNFYVRNYNRSANPEVRRQLLDEINRLGRWFQQHGINPPNPVP